MKDENNNFPCDALSFFQKEFSRKKRVNWMCTLSKFALWLISQIQILRLVQKFSTTSKRIVLRMNILFAVCSILLVNWPWYKIKPKWMFVKHKPMVFLIEIRSMVR